MLEDMVAAPLHPWYEKHKVLPAWQVCNVGLALNSQQPQPYSPSHHLKPCAANHLISLAAPATAFQQAVQYSSVVTKQSHHGAIDLWAKR